MKVVIVENEEEAIKAVDDAKADGDWRLAAISNAGLTGDQRQLTFLPASAFKDFKGM